MTNVAIIYFSGTGHTHLMAEAMATGTQTIPDAKGRCCINKLNHSMAFRCQNFSKSLFSWVSWVSQILKALYRKD
jgi:hypothetical protein